ncbi:MAG TPA: sigma-70 family RNA polymerase sigma factor [Myxococcota bacterium]|nr:sigma-70 family RNA polymerase sigma factor [Myxococcota bacterium]
MRRLCEQGAITLATAAVIRAYGPEIRGFLIAHHRSEEDGDEVFSLWSERVLRGLPRFGWHASLRTWAYTVARNASLNHVRGRAARARHEEDADTAAIAAVRQQVRTETAPFQRTASKDRLTAIRDALPAEDRMLLVLRVDKRLEWKDLARVMLDEGDEVAEAALVREAARLRKRFQLLKERLIEAARSAGILGEGGS